MHKKRAVSLAPRVRLISSLVVAAALAGCGGGGGGGSSSNCLSFVPNTTTCASTGIGTTAQTATQLSLSVDAPTIQTGSSAVVTLTATLKDAKNSVVPNATVTFTADSGTISGSTATTDTSGVATITFNSNDNKTNRTVNLTATSGSLSQSTSIIVQGTRIGFGGDTSAVRGKSASMSVTLLDGAGKAIANRAVSLTSKRGNPVPSSVTTDVSGQATITFVPTVAGTDTITASALGALLPQDLVVSAVNFAFDSPAADTRVNVGVAADSTVGCQPVSVSLSGTTAAAAKFTTSRGMVYSDSACSIGSALQTIPFSGSSAVAYVRSTGAGAATVYAELSGGASAALASLPIKFIATVPSTVVVQADPSVVVVDGSASVTAIVRDASGNPVSGQTVIFSAPDGGGVPNPTAAVTNDSGVASSSFKADSSISGKDSVRVLATVGALTPVPTTLTVAGKAVNIVIGTDNQIENIEGPPRYRKRWGVIVSDPASGPIKNQVVTIALRGIEFAKGSYTLPSTTTTTTGSQGWIQVVRATCPAEDLNNNGVVEAGEIGDVDLDGILEPNGAAIVRAPTATGGLSATVTTDESGAAEFWVEYFREFANWAKIELKATAAVAGTNSIAVRTFYLPGAAAELQDSTVSPSFQLSPFGQIASCYSH